MEFGHTEYVERLRESSKRSPLPPIGRGARGEGGCFLTASVSYKYVWFEPAAPANNEQSVCSLITGCYNDLWPYWVVRMSRRKSGSLGETLDGSGK